jgi:hypothetical protein
MSTALYWHKGIVTPKKLKTFIDVLVNNYEKYQARLS